MRTRQLAALACVALFLCFAVTGISTLRAQKADKTKQEKEKFPIVDYNTPEPADEHEKVKRKKKGEKYDNALSPINPARADVNQLEVVDFPAGTPSLPVRQSAAVIIGTVTKAQAHLSSDKSYVYSEFDVLVEEVMKDDSQSPIATGKIIAAERPGGRVKVPSGRTHEYKTTLNPLGVGCRYALFLTRRGDDYHVFTGYRLEGGQVFPIDRFFKRYEGAGEEEFMRDLRQAITSVTGVRHHEVDDSTVVVLAPVDPIEPDPTPDAGGDCLLPAPPPCVAPPSTVHPRFAPGAVTVT